MDLDCIGSMVLARYLFPDHQLIRSRFIHPAARNLYNLYKNHLNLLSAGELKNQHIEKIVIVDTRSHNRVLEYFKLIEQDTPDIEVFDHHHGDRSDLSGAVIHEEKVGANTTLLGLELIKRGISISHIDATIALTGVYADTGNFSHENLTIADFQVASYLMQHGASLKLIKRFLKSLKEEHQITLFHEILNRLTYKEFSGHFIILSYMELEKQVGGLAAVVEKVFEIENPDAIFAVFTFKKETQSLIIARSEKKDIDLKRILKVFNGGGHPSAASALLKNCSGPDVIENLEEYLQRNLLPAVSAEQIMSKQVAVINENWTLKEASIFLEKTNHTGSPVLNNTDELTGFMTLRDIMKGRKAEQMHSPVKAYMTKNVITGSENTTIRDIEKFLFSNNIGHLPIVDNKRVIGIVTRSDYLGYIEGKVSEL